MRLAPFARPLALLACAVGSATAQQLNTGTGVPLYNPFGIFSTTTYGETFLSPVGFSQLDQFTFEFQGFNNGGALLFRAFVMAWDGQEATGPVLYESDLTPGTDGGPTTFVFNTGGTAVTAGGRYVAFVNASEFFLDNIFTGLTAQMEAVDGPNPIPGGSFVSDNNFDDFGMLSTTPWDNTGTSPDLAFTATFSTPEPATLGLFGTGLLAVAGIARRRKTRTPI